jgi:cysteinyl-tRNA synthetase
MSKSLGNFFTIREVLAGHEPEALRLFLIGTHYRKPITFEVEALDGAARYVSLEDAEKRLAYTYTTLARIDAALAVGKEPGPGEVLAPADDFIERHDAALDDDFNTAAALGLCSELLTLANRLLDQPKSAPKAVRRRTLGAIRAGLDHVHRTMGIFGQEPSAYLERRRTRLCQVRGIDPVEVERRIAERTAARQQKDFAGADAIRDELAESGVELMDSPTGTTWRIAE